MRIAFGLLLFIAGCAAPPLPRIESDDPTITADLAIEGAAALVRSSGTFSPSPVVPVGDDCENCGGTGKTGDSSHIIVTCPKCGGTGKRK